MIYTPQSPVEVLALIVTIVVGVLVLASSAGSGGGGEASDRTPAPGETYLPSVFSQPGPRGDRGWVLAALLVITALGLGAAWLSSHKYI